MKRDAVVALSSDAVVACGMNPGTAAEVSLAIKAGKPVVLLRADAASSAFFRALGGRHVRLASSAPEAIDLLRSALEVSPAPQGEESRS